MSGAIISAGDPSLFQTAGQPNILLTRSRQSSAQLAAAITKTASSQTYWTIRILADPLLLDDAYRAYAYFRWVDDVLDQELADEPARAQFLQRQQGIIDAAYQGLIPASIHAQEQMAVDLIAQDPNPNSGLAVYIKEMMAVMAFDMERKGRFISASERDSYTRALATAVTEALHYFIGHDDPVPQTDFRCAAVTGAHITHMLRDLIEDTQMGYYNVPEAVLRENGLAMDQVHDEAFRAWVANQVQEARDYFAKGRKQLALVKNSRCRLAGYAYIARFEIILDAIERDQYVLRASYPERKSLRARVRMVGQAISQALATAVSRQFAVLDGALFEGTA